MSERLESDKVERQEPKEPRKLPIDWTESDWFAIWLRMARGEHVPKTEPAAS